MKICFTGDLFLGGDLLNRDASDIVNVRSFTNADRRVVNLEQAISDTNVAADKCTLFSDSSSLDRLKELNVQAVNIANNHIQDKGINGIAETRQHFVKSNIGVFGAGADLTDARTKYIIEKNLVLIGYCDFEKKYLNQIEVASVDSTGINPLRYNNVLDDLNTLDVDEKAILYFHWGKEHVFLPTRNDLALSKVLLNHPKVLLIVGMHAHRVQGYVQGGQKRAYMSLGNFLFPNFYISPPTQITYPSDVPVKVDVTRLYHSVYNLTYKKWKWINRVSLILEYDTVTHAIKHIPVVQNDDLPEVSELEGFQKQFINTFILFLSLVYRLNSKFYHPLEIIHSKLLAKKWTLGVQFFKIKQLGARKVLDLLIEKFK